MPVSRQIDAAAKPPSIAYLLSNYPMLSMIFIVREVLHLRELGLRIDVASINPPDRAPQGLTDDEAAEAAHTYCLKKHGAAGALRAHLKTLVTRPFGYLRGLRWVLRLSSLDPRRLFFHLMYFTEALMVGHWMRRKGQTHLHAHLAQQAATVGLYVRYIFNAGFSITVHGPDEFYDVRGQYLAEKIEAADFICCISSFARSQMMRCCSYDQWSKFVVARLGVDPQVFSPQPPRVAPETFEVLCVGRLIPAKGQHVLIDAVARLALEGRRVRLRLVGLGPDETSLRERAAHIASPDCVVFDGGVNQDRIRCLYAAADIFCIPSFAEGIPVVLMEAMAMGIPCVTTHITGIPELIRDGIDGLLVAPSDLDALVSALSRLMDDAALRQRIAGSARERIVEHYNLRRNVERLAAIFAERIGA